uniref:NADH-ubiquinone oxidoreductase chain 3 n=1 Tax=Chaetocnema depressa TaxID=1425539 RepID=A0A3G1GPF0_9CUCU|nr:NADH dehydrogenase subunit 3 [Chaetocnema depressa]
MFYLSLMIIMILTVLILLINLLSKKTFYDREKNSPFECGFDPKTTSRLPFSLHFFLIAMIFLIFDIEIVLLIPFIYTLKFTHIMNYIFLFTFFILILLMGIYHEWKQGALEWMK